MFGKFYLVLHNIRSAYNVGAIFRTAEAAGINKMYLGGYTPLPRPLISGLQPSAKTDKIAKTALGAEKLVPWESCRQTGKLLRRLKKEKVKIVALEQAVGAVDYRKFKPRFPLALVLGNEIKGLDRRFLKYCDRIIKIPMRGQKESLNVAVAAGIALYEIQRQLKTEN